MRERVSTIIEGGHFYADQKHSPLQEEDREYAKHGIRLALDLHNITDESFIWWFIDNLHGEDFNQAIYKDLLLQWGNIPIQTVYEADPGLLTEALHLTERIPSNMLLKLRKGVSLINGGGQPNQILYKNNKYTPEPMCALIDAALYLRKWEFLEEKGDCITVLPEKYRGQQKNTLDILNAIKVRIPITNIYFDKTGEIKLVEGFRKNL
jgi:hypothetical protein